MNMLEFFDITLEYTNMKEKYTEPANTIKTIITNILNDELYSINNENITPLKSFIISKKE